MVEVIVNLLSVKVIEFINFEIIREYIRKNCMEVVRI